MAYQLKKFFIDITNHVIYENWLENICNLFCVFLKWCIKILKNGTLKFLKMVHWC